jgi:hypothetical protein
MEVATTASKQRKQFVEGGHPAKTPNRKDLTPRRKDAKVKGVWEEARSRNGSLRATIQWVHGSARFALQFTCDGHLRLVFASSAVVD